MGFFFQRISNIDVDFMKIKKNVGNPTRFVFSIGFLSLIVHEFLKKYINVL